MQPTLCEGMYITIEECKRELCCPGDIIVRQGPNSFVIHRVTHVRLRKGKRTIYTKGDSCLNFDPPLNEDEPILGKAIKIYCQCGVIDLSSPNERRYSKILAIYSRVSGQVVALVKHLVKAGRRNPSKEDKWVQRILGELFLTGLIFWFGHICGWSAYKFKVK